MTNDTSINEQILRVKQVKDITGLSIASIYRFEKAGKFPKRFHLSEKLVGWKMSDIQAWINSR